VFALPLHQLARVFLMLASPEIIREPALARAARRNLDAIHAAPAMVGGFNHFSEILCADLNLIAKDGALGVLLIGLRAERLGIAIRVVDGSHGLLPLLALSALRQLHYANSDTLSAIAARYPKHIVNDNGHVVGHIEIPFQFQAGAR